MKPSHPAAEPVMTVRTGEERMRPACIPTNPHPTRASIFHPVRDGLADRVIACAARVHSAIGPGYPERVYENALAHELQRDRIPAQVRLGIDVPHGRAPLGQIVADLLVEERLLVEVEAVKALGELHLAHGFNYLKNTGLKACLVLNFGAQILETRRLVPSPDWSTSEFL